MKTRIKKFPNGLVQPLGVNTAKEKAIASDVKALELMKHALTKVGSERMIVANLRYIADFFGCELIQKRMPQFQIGSCNSPMKNMLDEVLGITNASLKKERP